MNKIFLSTLLLVFCSASFAAENENSNQSEIKNFFCQVFKFACGKTDESVEPNPKDRITPDLATDLPRDRNNVQNPIAQGHLNPSDNPGF